MRLSWLEYYGIQSLSCYCLYVCCLCLATVFTWLEYYDIVDSVSMPTADNRGTAQATGRCPDKVGQLSIMCRLDPRHTSVCCLSTVFSHLASSSCKFLFLQLEYYGIVRLGWHCLLSEDEGYLMKLPNCLPIFL